MIVEEFFFLASLIKRAEESLFALVLFVRHKYSQRLKNLFLEVRETLFAPQFLYSAELLIAYPFYPIE